ncbi:MAG: zinc-ribbon domain-containing protein [Myxococcota bacterium]
MNKRPFTSTRASTWASALTCLFSSALFLAASVALAQHDAGGSTAPPPPAGPGSLTVAIVHPTDIGETAGLSIALYALTPDGMPGFKGGETGPDGTFTFEGISNDPGIIYLVGARYQEIPFGERITFAPDETNARVEVEISAPTDRVEKIRVGELRARIDWMGDRLVVREILSVENESGSVIQLKPSSRAKAIVERPLPEAARDYLGGGGAGEEGFTFEGNTMRFAGPLYPGDQSLEYQYSLPLPKGDDVDAKTLSLPLKLRERAERVVVVAGTEGLTVEGKGLVASRELLSDSGNPLSSWAGGALRPGKTLVLNLGLPESRLDASLISMPRADIWLEVDDTRMTATVDLQMKVEPGAPVSGTPDAPLMRIVLPKGATLNGVAPEAEGFGLEPRADGGFDVIGPIGPGESNLGYSYQMAGRAEGLDLDLRFPIEVTTLNVLIADTGLALDSGRLHRRRPFRNGTRNYLHREAFNVAPDEVVDLSIDPLTATDLPRSATLAFTLSGVAAAALFLMTPLRAAARREQAIDPEQAQRALEQDAIYASIADLEHDFETGKLEEADYTQMREELRGEAIALLRRERASGGPASQVAASGAGEGQATSSGSATSSSDAHAATSKPSIGKFCPHCGGQLSEAWRFCSHCGEALASDADSANG